MAVDDLMYFKTGWSGNYPSANPESLAERLLVVAHLLPSFYLGEYALLMVPNKEETDAQCTSILNLLQIPHDE